MLHTWQGDWGAALAEPSMPDHGTGDLELPEQRVLSPSPAEWQRALAAFSHPTGGLTVLQKARDRKTHLRKKWGTRGGADLGRGHSEAKYNTCDENQGRVHFPDGKIEHPETRRPAQKASFT